MKEFLRMKIDMFKFVSYTRQENEQSLSLS